MIVGMSCVVRISTVMFFEMFDADCLMMFLCLVCYGMCMGCLWILNGMFMELLVNLWNLCGSHGDFYWMIFMGCSLDSGLNRFLLGFK